MLPHNPLDQLNSYPAISLSPLQLTGVVILLMMAGVYLFLRARTFWQTLIALAVGTMAAYLTVLVTGYPAVSLHDYLAELREFAEAVLQSVGLA